jgi:hypothetical protein
VANRLQGQSRPHHRAAPMALGKAVYGHEEGAKVVFTGNNAMPASPKCGANRRRFCATRGTGR